MKVVLSFVFVPLILGMPFLLACAQHNNSVTITSQIDTGVDIILVDDGNIAALDSSATDGYDSGLDVPEPAPPVSNYLATYFPHPEWGSIFGDNFMIDVRDADDDLINAVKIYRFEVDTDQTWETVALSFAIGSTYPTVYGVVLYDVDAGDYQNLRENAAYNFTAGATERRFDLRLGDGTPPMISITYPTAGVTLLSNTAYTLTWTCTDVTPIRYSKVYYSLDAGANWTLIDSISGEAGSCPWTTPDTVCTQAKIKVEAEDWAGNSATEVTSHTFTIAPGYLEHSFASGWHITSIPLIPEYTSIDSIYGDDVTGTYFVYDYSQSAGYGLVQNVAHGSGYWLALENAALINLEGSTAIDSIFLSLNLNWNIVGAAMAQPVARDSLLFTDGNVFYGFTEAVSSGWIAPAFYNYDNSSGSYTAAATLEPWSGYWLQVLMEGLQMITVPPYGESWLDNGGSDGINDEDEWFIPIIITQDDHSDYLAGFGVHFEATEGYDTWYDLPSPPFPPSGEYVRLVFYRPEWSAPVGDVFSRDLRAPIEQDTSVIWEGVIEASHDGDVTVSFGEIAQILPDDYTASAEYDGQILDLLETPVFSFEYLEPVQISVMVRNGTTSVNGSRADLPYEFGIISAHPNPFNPALTVDFAIPSRSHTNLFVFDLKGRVLSSLAQGLLDPGSYTVVFDGTGFASGVYFLHLQMGELQQTAKILLLK